VLRLKAFRKAARNFGFVFNDQEAHYSTIRGSGQTLKATPGLSFYSSNQELGNFSL
jgi:hypothetical protein